MFRFILFCLMVFTSTIVRGQAQDSITVIRLVDGSTFVAKEIEKDSSSGKITLRIGDQKIFISSEDVVYLKKEAHLKKNDEKRIINRTSLSFLNGSFGNGYGVHHTVFYNANKYLNTGVGVGINNYLTQSGYNLFPLYLDLSIKLRESRIAPYFSLIFGYSFARADDDLGQIEANGGRLFAPRFGYGFETDHVLLDVYCGLRFQNASYVYRIWEGEGTDVLNYKRLELGLGISF